MVYFRCTSSGSGKGNTVIVTCAEQFAGVAITIAKIGKSYTKVCPLSAPYVVKFYGVEAGTYTVSATVSGQTYSAEVVVQDVSCVLNYGFTWKTWVDTASQLDSTDYASLSEVLADEEAVRELFLEHACVDYMADSTSSNADLETIIENDLCAKWINNSDYALDFLGANTVIKALMDTADKYGYGEWVIVDDTTTPPTYGPKGNVPVMTANNAPYGVASQSSAYSSESEYGAWHAFRNKFDGTGGNGNCWQTTSGSVTNQHITYKFANPICVKAFDIMNTPYANEAVKTFKLQGSNDGSTFTDIKGTTTHDTTASKRTRYTCANNNYYLYIRLLCLTNNGGSVISINTLQFYGRSLSVSVPTMTSNTSPFGECIARSMGADGSEGAIWRAFDNNNSTYWHNNRGTDADGNSWIGYKFGEKIAPKMLVYSSRHYNSERIPKQIKLQGSDDYSTWNDIESFIPSDAGSTLQYFAVSENIAYKALRAFLVAKDGITDLNKDVQTLQFYGLDYSEKEFEAGTTKKWLYDHGVELETIDALSSDNNVNNYVTKKDDELYIHKQGSNSGAAAITNTAIDLTPFSLIRAKCGDELTNMRISVRSAKSVNDNVDVAVIAIGAANANLPNNLSLDVSAVNQSGYPTIGLYQGGTSDVNYMTVKEFWLE